MEGRTGVREGARAWHSRCARHGREQLTDKTGRPRARWVATGCGRAKLRDGGADMREGKAGHGARVGRPGENTKWASPG
jgi:hypothetical protein